MIITDKNKRIFAEIVLWIISILVVVYAFINAYYNVLSNDEATTVIECQKTLSSIVGWAGEDYHPPFYYFLVSIVYHLFGDSVRAFTILSLVPLLVTILVTRFFVCKEFGYLSGIIYVLFWGMMPQSVYNLAEVRMYSWGGLFLSLSLLSFYNIVKRDLARDWVLFGLFSIIGAYTHYFVLVHVAFFYVVLFLHQLIKKSYKNFLIVAICAVVLYLPWLANVFRATQKAAESFWSSWKMPWQEGIRTLFENNWLYLIFILVFAYNIYTYARKKEIDARFWMSLCGTVSVVATMLFGFAFSYRVHPMYHGTYIYFASVISWLLFAINLGIKQDVFCEILSCLSVLVIILHCYPQDMKKLDNEKTDYQFMMGLVDEYEKYEDKPKIVVYEDTHLLNVASYYFPLGRSELVEKISDSNTQSSKWIIFNEEDESNLNIEDIDYSIVAKGRISYRNAVICETK